jgi:hypothetical protein
MSADPFDDLSALRPEELNFLASVVKRACQSVLGHHSPIDLTTNPSHRRDPPQETLYVASLAFNLPNPAGHSHTIPRRLDQRGAPGLSLERYSIVEFRGEANRLWSELPRITEDFIGEAQALPGVRQAPHFVLLNELSHAFEDSARLQSRWAELARHYRTYVVPGTFHCTTEYVSVAPIHCPNPDRSTFALKLNAAAKQNEKIRTPDARQLYIFETDFGNVVLWICLDMYDPGLVLKFLNVTHRFSARGGERAKPNREVSLVLVPAYSADSQENIGACVRSISRFSKTAMVCANAMYPSRQESYGFGCGEPLGIVLEKSYPLPGSNGIACRATLYGVDLRALRTSQAANYSTGIWSSAFAAIINGSYVVHDVPD